MTKEAPFTIGDFTFDRPKNVIQVDNRGLLDHLRRGNQAAITFSFSAKLKDRRLRHTLEDYIWEQQTKGVTGLTQGALNENIPVDSPYVQGTLTLDSGETGWTKLAAGATPAVEKEFAEEVGSEDLEGLTVVGDAETTGAATPGQFAAFMPGGDTDLDVIYDAVGQSTKDPGASDVKTLKINLEKLDITDPTRTAVSETYELDNVFIENVSQAEGDEFDVLTFNGFAYVTRLTVS